MSATNITPNDLGFGTKGADRSMNKDGSFNVERTGEPAFRPYEIYHALITMSWKRFILLILCGYFIVNVLFAAVYYAIGVEHLTGMDRGLDEFHKFMEAFFFSSQTLTTVGFGRIAPLGMAASSVAAIESMLGVLGFALATGLLYGRFSRPKAKLLFSNYAIIAPYRGGAGLMFRVANLRRSQLIEIEVEITLAYFEKGAVIRSFLPLLLERRKINLFPLSWTIVHPIDANSPLYNISESELKEMKTEVIVLLKAFDESFSQIVYSRTSFHAHEILYAKKFLPMFFVQSNGQSQLNFKLIDAMESAALPVIAEEEEKQRVK
ncbi:MAG TPA: ion channel [Bacteroidia bacterium]|nr:ion channel [Bacteroidia bacterium]